MSQQDQLMQKAQTDIYNLVNDPEYSFWGQSENQPSRDEFDTIMQNPESRNGIFDDLSKLGLLDPQQKQDFNKLYTREIDTTWNEDVGKDVGEWVEGLGFNPEDDIGLYGAGIGAVKGLLDFADVFTFNAFGFSEIGDAMETELRSSKTPSEITRYDSLRDQGELAEMGVRAGLNSAAFVIALGKTRGKVSAKGLNFAKVFQAFEKSISGAKGVGKLAPWIGKMGTGFVHSAVTFTPHQIGKELRDVIIHDENFSFTDIGKGIVEMGIEGWTESIFPEGIGIGKTAMRKAMTSYPISSFFEGFSEMIGDAVMEGEDSALAKIIQGEDMTRSQKNQALVGFILGAGMGLPSSIVELAKAKGVDIVEAEKEAKAIYKDIATSPEKMEKLRKKADGIVAEVADDPKKVSAYEITKDLNSLLAPEPETDTRLQANELLAPIEDSNVMDQMIAENILAKINLGKSEAADLIGGYSSHQVHQATNKIVQDVKLNPGVIAAAEKHGTTPSHIANIAIGQKMGLSDTALAEILEGDVTLGILESKPKLQQFAPESFQTHSEFNSVMSGIAPATTTSPNKKKVENKKKPEKPVAMPKPQGIITEDPFAPQLSAEELMSQDFQGEELIDASARARELEIEAIQTRDKEAQAQAQELQRKLKEQQPQPKREEPKVAVAEESPAPTTSTVKVKGTEYTIDEETGEITNTKSGNPIKATSPRGIAVMKEATPAEVVPPVVEEDLAGEYEDDFVAGSIGTAKPTPEGRVKADAMIQKYLNITDINDLPGFFGGIHNTFVKKVVELLPQLQIEVVYGLSDTNGMPTRAEYAWNPDTDSHTISINVGYEGWTGSSEVNQAVFHELVHALTVKGYFENVEFQKEIQTIMIDVYKHLPKVMGLTGLQKSLYDKLIESNPKDFGKWQEGFTEIWETLSSEDKLKYYAFTSPIELMGELYSGTISAEAFQLLANIPSSVDPKQTSWQRLVQAIKRLAQTLIDVPESSKLDELNMLMEKTFDFMATSVAIKSGQAIPDSPIFHTRKEKLDYTMDQKRALSQINEWLESPDSKDRHFALDGAAGTGKTTIIENIVRRARQEGIDVTVHAPTNRAVRVLQSKNESMRSIFSTLHKHLFTPKKVNGKLTFIPKDDVGGPGTLLIIDESSMVGTKMYNTLQEQIIKKGGKVLFIGDSHQLPPVGDINPGILGEHNIGNTNYAPLNEVRRQALESSILKLATAIRTLKATILPIKTEKDVVVDNRAALLSGFYADIKRNADSVWLTGTNSIRVNVNIGARKAKYGEEVNLVPRDKDKLVGITNGSLYVNSEGFTFNEKEWNRVEAFTIPQIVKGKPVDQPIYVYEGNNTVLFVAPIHRAAGLHASSIPVDLIPPKVKGLLAQYEMIGKNGIQDVDIATYGYALTVHKAQGGQWDTVYVGEGGSYPKDGGWAKMEDDYRWVYTAVTRAAKKLKVSRDLTNKTYSWNQIDNSVKSSQANVEIPEEVEVEVEVAAKEPVPPPPQQPPVEVPQHDYEGEAELAVQSAENQNEMDRITSGDTEVINTKATEENIENDTDLQEGEPGVLVSAISSLKTLGKSIAAYFKKAHVGNDIDMYLKTLSKTDFDTFFSLMATDNDNVKIQEARASMKKEWSAKYKHKMKFEYFLELKRNAKWNEIQNKDHRKVMNISITKNKNGVVYKRTELSGKYKDPGGKNQSTFGTGERIEQIAGQLEAVLGTGVEVVYINSFQYGFQNKGWFDLARDHPELMSKDLGQYLADEGYIYLNRFGDKSLTPVLKLQGEITPEGKALISELEEMYMGEGDTAATTEAIRNTNVLYMVIKELTIGNNIENIISKENKELLAQNMTIVNAMKRAQIANEMLITTVQPETIQRFSLTDSAKSPVGVVFEDGTVKFKRVVVQTEYDPKETENYEEAMNTPIDMGMRDRDGLPITVPLGSLLKNSAGVSRTDGITFYLLGKDQAGALYREIKGALDSGPIKSVVGGSGMYFKDSRQGISATSTIGKWMVENDLAEISFETTEKNGSHKNNKYKLVSLQELQAGNVQDSVIPVPIESMDHNKVYGSVKSSVRGFMQAINSSALTTNNPVLVAVDPNLVITRTINKLLNNLATKFNANIEEWITDPEIVTGYLAKMMDATDDHTLALASLIQDNLVYEGEKVNLTKTADALKNFYRHPYMNALLQDRVNSMVEDLMKYRMKGSKPVLSPNMGYLAYDRDIDSVKRYLKWDVLDLPIDSDVFQAGIPDTQIGEWSFKQTLKQLISMEGSRAELKQLLSTGVDAFDIPLTEARISEITTQEKTLFTDILATKKSLVTAFNAFHKDSKGFKPATMKTHTSGFIDSRKAVVADWINKQTDKYIDENGFLKHGYVIISSDIAAKNGLKVGDKIMTTITPTSSIQGLSGAVVAGIGSPANMDVNSMIMNSDYIQGVGKDYDIDVVSLFAHDESLIDYSEWSKMIDGLVDIDVAYINKTAAAFEKRNVPTKNFINAETGEFNKRAYVSDQNNQTLFLKRVLGSTEKAGTNYKSTMGDDTHTVGDQFGKSVGIISSQRTFHTLLNQIGFKTRITDPHGESVTIDPSSNFAEAQAVLDLITNEEVDFPKRTTKLEHNNEEWRTHSIAVTGTDKLDAFTSDVIASINSALFGEIIAVSRGKTLNGDVSSVDITKSYINSTKETLEMLQNKDVDGLKTKIEDKVTKSLDDSQIARAKEIMNLYFSNMELGSLKQSPMLNVAQMIDQQSITKALSSYTYDDYRKAEYQVWDVMRQLYGVVTDKMANAGFENLKKWEGANWNNLDTIEKRSGAYVSGMYYYDSKNNGLWNENPESSIQYLRSRLIAYLIPVTQTDAAQKPSADLSARKDVYTEQLAHVFAKKPLNFAIENPKNRSWAKSEVPLKVGDATITAFRNTADGLSFKVKGSDGTLYKILSTELTNEDSINKPVNKWLKEKLLGEENIFVTGDNATANRVSLGKLIKMESKNIDIEDRIDMAKRYYNKVKENYDQDALDTVFNSLLVPYVAVIEKRSEKEYTRLQAQKGRRVAMTGKYGEGSSYQANSIPLRLADGTNRRWLNQYVKQFTHTSGVFRTSSIGFQTTVAEKEEKVLDRLRDRRHVHDKSKTPRLSMIAFARRAKKNPKTAYKELQNLMDDTRILAGLEANPALTWSLSDIIADVQAGNYERFSVIYNQGEPYNLKTTVGVEVAQLEQNEYGSAEVKKMTELFYNLNKLKNEISKDSPSRWNKRLKSLQSLDWFALNNAKNIYSRTSKLNLPILDLKKREGYITNQLIKPVIDSMSAFYSDLKGMASESAVFLERARDWNRQTAEITGDLGTLIDKSQELIKNIIDREIKKEGTSRADAEKIAVETNEKIWNFAEAEWKKDPYLDSIMIVPTSEGYSFQYGEEVFTEDAIIDKVVEYKYDNGYESRGAREWAESVRAALQYRKIFDGYVPARLLRTKEYLEKIYNDYLAQGTSIALLEAKKLSKTITQYEKIYETIINWDSTHDTKYMPHNYNDNLFKAAFTAEHYDKILAGLKLRRDKANRELNAGKKTVNKIAFATDADLNKQAKDLTDEQYNELYTNNPMMAFNPNWAERLVEGVEYDKQTDMPIRKYIENYAKKFAQDMTDVDSGLYKTRAIANGESQFVIETTMEWFGQQSRNKRLHTKEVGHTNIKAGMEIEFHYYNHETYQYTADGRKLKYPGEFVRRDGASVYLRSLDGTERVIKHLGGEITTGKTEDVMWGKVSKISNGNATFNKIDREGNKTEVVVASSDMFTRDSLNQKVEGKVGRYWTKGSVEFLDNVIREKGLSAQEGTAMYYMLKLIPSTFRMIDKTLVLSILGGPMQFVAGTANFIGGHFINFMSNPKKYMGYRKQGMKMIKQALDVEWKNMSDIEKATTQDQQKYSLYRLLRSSGLAGDEVMDLVAENGAMGLNSNLMKLGVPSQARTLLRLLQDKYGWSKYNAEKMALAEELYTADEVRKAQIHIAMKQLDAKWLDKKIQMSKGSGSSINDKLMNKLVGKATQPGFDLNEAMGIDRTTAMKLTKGLLSHYFNKGMFKFFLMPENHLRKTSIAIALQEGKMAGLEGQDLLNYASRMERNTQAKYEDFEKQLINSTEMGRFFNKFGHYKYNRIKSMTKGVIPEAITQVALEGMGSMKTSMIEHTDKDGNKTYTPNAAQKLLTTFMFDTIARVVKNKYIWGIGIIGSPFFESIYAGLDVLKMILKGGPDEDEELGFFYDVLESTPLGLGKGTLLQFPMLPADTEWQEYNRSTKAIGQVAKKDLADMPSEFFTRFMLAVRPAPGWFVEQETEDIRDFFD